MEKEREVWSNCEFMPWDEAVTHPTGHGLHYGRSIFEGIKFYRTDRGSAIFRLQDHLDRLLHSANVMRLTRNGRIMCAQNPYPLKGKRLEDIVVNEFSLEELRDIVKELIVRNEMQEGYIRPLFFHVGTIGVKTSATSGGRVEGMIEVRQWIHPKKEFIRVKTSPYCRIHDRSTDVGAKIGGHYVNSLLAFWDAEDAGLDEAILLDYKGGVAEASVENIFVVKDNVLYTPRLGTILPGVTRATVITLARDSGFRVEETTLYPEDLEEADEIFLCGTAMEVIPVGEIDGVQVGNGGRGPFTRRITDLYHDVVEGRVEQYRHWLTLVHEQGTGT